MRKILSFTILFFYAMSSAQGQYPPPPPPKDYLFYDNKNYGAFVINKEYNINEFERQETKTGNYGYLSTIKKNNNIIAFLINTYTTTEDRGNLNYDFYGNGLKKLPVEQRARARKESYTNIASGYKQKYNLETLDGIGTRKNSLGQYYEYFYGDSKKENKIFVVATFRNNYKFHFLLFFFKKSLDSATNNKKINDIDSFLSNFWIYNDYSKK